LLGEASAIADKPDGGYKQLSAEIKLADAEISLSQGHLPEAKAQTEKLLALIGTQFPVIAIGAKRVLGLAQLYAGAAAIGKRTCAEAVEMAKRVNDPGQLARAQLALAEAMLLAGDRQASLTSALQAQESFTRRDQHGGEWQSWVIAAGASRSVGDNGKAREYALRASESLSKLEQRWGTANYNSYLSRPDIRRLWKQLNELTGSSR